MVTSALIEKLDKKNASQNAELSKARFKEGFSSATSEQKKQIASLSMRKINTLYKIYSDGIISVRVLVAISFILNVSPFWYSGEAEDKEVYSDELMRQFLNDKGYESALQPQSKEEKPKRVYKRRNKNSASNQKENTIDTKSKEEPEEAEQKDWRETDDFRKLMMEDAMKLLEALYIRAEINPSENDKLLRVFELLLS